MLQPGRKYSAGSGYRYGFNGKENDNDVKGEGNQQDYGMRIYDPRLGRFLSVDPISSEYPWNSTYAFAENDVIRSIDLDGLEKLALSGAAPLSQYNKKGPDGATLPGRTAFNRWHVAGFKAQADRLKKEYGFESHQVFTGQQIVSRLKQTTKAHGNVSFLAIFTHSGVTSTDPSGVGGLFMSYNAGLYQNKVDVGSRSPGYATISDIKKSMTEGTIKFSKDATVFIDGCNVTSSSPGVASNQNFAYEFVMSTGIQVIATSAKSVLVDEKKLDGSFKVPDDKPGSFYRLSREEYWEEEEIPNYLRGTYGGDSETIKVSVQKFRIKVENLGREVKVDNYIKKDP